MKIKKGDKVQVLSGKDKGNEGVVISALPAQRKVIVDGVTIPAGTLDWARWGIKGGTSAKRALFTGLGASLGDYYDCL